jgi:hypothetical protein
MRTVASDAEHLTRKQPEMGRPLAANPGSAVETDGRPLLSFFEDVFSERQSLVAVAAQVQQEQSESAARRSSANVKMASEAAISFGVNVALSGLHFGSHWTTLLKRSALTGAFITGFAEVLPDLPRVASERLQSPKPVTGDELNNLGWKAAKLVEHVAINTASGFIGAKTGMAVFHPGDVYPGIPTLRHDGFLPEGVHLASWSEFTSKFAYNTQRQEVSAHLLDALHDLRDSGAKDVWIGGSLVTRKLRPNDFDLGYASFPEHLKRMPVLWDREMMKEAYHGEMWPDCLNYYRLNTRVGKRIGVVQIDLNTLPQRTRFSPARQVLEHHQFAAEQSLLEGKPGRWSPALDQERLIRTMNALKERRQPVPELRIGGSDNTFSPAVVQSLNQRAFLRTDVPPEPVRVRKSILRELNGQD